MIPDLQYYIYLKPRDKDGSNENLRVVIRARLPIAREIIEGKFISTISVLLLKQKLQAAPDNQQLCIFDYHAIETVHDEDFEALAINLHLIMFMIKRALNLKYMRLLLPNLSILHTSTLWNTYTRDIIPPLWLMVRQKLEELTLCMDFHLLPILINQESYHDHFIVFLPTFKQNLILVLHSWLEHHIYKFIMNLLEIFFDLIINCQILEKIKKEEFLLKIYQNGLFVFHLKFINLWVEVMLKELLQAPE
ncbi:unnamed protein product [Paramecium sonneborni]|uniref:Uncharacterized protein n=1 Tax=Paramecium sonneborni TaxID=65129 RepID=A0A8S1JXP8_9CILI|nr:unnamed protein product [Paramecium sonneborni]